MVRWPAALLLLSIACDAGAPPSPNVPPPSAPRPGKLTRADIDNPLLPHRGIGVRTMGRNTYVSLELVDLDAKTLRVTAHNIWSKRIVHVHQTLPLSEFDVKRLTTLADRARHEVAHGTLPSSFNAQELSVVDGDDAFDIRGDLIGANQVRPDAAALVQAILEYSARPLEQMEEPHG